MFSCMSVSSFRCSRNSSPLFLSDTPPVMPLWIRHPVLKPVRFHLRRPARLCDRGTHARLSRSRGAQYYPANINHSRCCDQAICTECFVQIKRSEPTTTHLVSEPAACPYCVQEHFGVVYTPPPWRTGIGGDGSVCFPVESLGVDFWVPNPTFVRRLRHGRILPRGDPPRQKSRGGGHVAVRALELIALTL